jgi:hypothetical protein
MSNDELKREADELMARVRLSEALGSYAQWFVGGSYSYDLMVWRDLDVYALDPDRDLRACFEVGYALSARLPAWKARFTNNFGGKPNGYYWGLKTGDERAGAWKLDVWFLDQEDYSAHRAYSAAMGRRLTTETRAAICAIKESYWRRAEYRDTVTSADIYRAVLDHGVRRLEDFAQWRAGRQSG